MARRRRTRTRLRPRWRYLALLPLLAFLLYEGWYGARILHLRGHAPTTTAFMERQRQTLGRPLRHTWVPYERIAEPLKRAVVVAEDARFASHHGFDWRGIRRALEKNLREGEVVAGGSTITQQLAKNLFLSGARSWPRKLQEALLTLMLEAALSKRRILELYLNLVEWGEGVFGAEAAARHYYGTSAAWLGPDRAAWLAVMLPQPRYYDRAGATDWLARRAADVERQLPLARIP